MSKIFLKNTWLHLFVWPTFARVCLSQRMSILRLKVHYGRGLMSSELPKKGSQLLDGCQCTRISSLCVTGAFRSVNCFIDPSLPCPFRYIYLHISIILESNPLKLRFPMSTLRTFKTQRFFFPSNGVRDPTPDEWKKMKSFTTNLRVYNFFLLKAQKWFPEMRVASLGLLLNDDGSYEIFFYYYYFSVWHLQYSDTFVLKKKKI